MHGHIGFLGMLVTATIACGGAVSGGVTDAGSLTEGGASAGGGQTTPPATGSGGGSTPPAGSSAAGASGGGSTPEAGSAAPGRGDASPPPPPVSSVGCAGGPGGGSAGGGGSSGAGSCDIMTQQTCDGVNYLVDCACPQGSCACFGSTTTVVTFTGCPTCPTIAQANAICGFPN
jgi:hypothetical protein